MITIIKINFSLIQKKKIIKKRYYTQKDIFVTFNPKEKVFMNILKDSHLDIIIKKEDTIIIYLQ